MKKAPLFLLSLAALAGVLGFAGCTTLQTSIEINAPAKNVRAVLYKFDDYPKWNPFIIKVDGDAKVGAEVMVTVKPVGKDQLAGKTTIDATDDGRLAWTGSLAVPGVFSGAHEFVIEEVGPNKVVFHQNEKMRGIAVLFLDTKPIEAGFVEMNKALKQQAEAAK